MLELEGQITFLKPILEDEIENTIELGMSYVILNHDSNPFT